MAKRGKSKTSRVMKWLGLWLMTAVCRCTVIVLIFGGAMCAAQNLIGNFGAGVLGLLAAGLGILLAVGTESLLSRLGWKH